MDLVELGALLRSSRGRVHPADVGLGAGPRRQVTGLRRAEVARLAGTSPGYYAALEQGAGARPSVQTLAALARALRLDEDDYARSCRLAGRPTPAPGASTAHVLPGLLHLLDALAATPAQVVTDRRVVVVQNRLATLVLDGPDRTDPVGAGPECPELAVVRLDVQHPVVGTVALERRSLPVEGAGQRLLWYAPVPGTDAAARLRLLAVVGLQDLTGA